MENQDAEGKKDHLFFIGEYSSAEGEEEMEVSQQNQQKRCKQDSRLSREKSPPLLLIFNTSGRSTSSPASSEEDGEQEEEEDSDQPIEDWMILSREKQVGDSSIQLNLSYWKDSEEDSGDEDLGSSTEEDIWAVSEKDKCGAEKSQTIRYWVPNSQICNLCNRTGHFAKSCYYHKKSPTCVLCGTQGHIQKDCPGRPCSSCGLPSHGSRPCQRPPVWIQHCQRCGMAGHLSDTCPDTWRQYHTTIRLKVPIIPPTVHSLRHKEGLAHCYNCSKRGHYGHECTKRRMVSGTFPSLPYVCYYDTIDDVLKHVAVMQKRAKELMSAGSVPLSDQLSEPPQESGEENQPIQGRSRTKQAGRRKTWPERRRERREVKRLRREAQARREGGLLGRSRRSFHDEVCPSDPFTSPLLGQRQSTPPPQKKRKCEASCRRSKKSREAERWKKRGGLKHGDLYPHGDVDIGSEKLLSPKQRVRHRRR